jgi:hypothetical protein
MSKKPSYTKRMEAKLAIWEVQFQAERAEAEKAGAKLATNVRERLEASKVAGDTVRAKLRDLMAAAARYSKIREELEEAWSSIAGPLDKAEGADAVEAAPPRKLASGA